MGTRVRRVDVPAEVIRVGLARLDEGGDRAAAMAVTATFALYVMINGAMVMGLAPVVGVRPTRLSVRDQQTRWGSASKTPRLSCWMLDVLPCICLRARLTVPPKAWP